MELGEDRPGRSPMRMTDIRAARISRSRRPRPPARSPPGRPARPSARPARTWTRRPGQRPRRSRGWPGPRGRRPRSGRCQTPFSALLSRSSDLDSAAAPCPGGSGIPPGRPRRIPVRHRPCPSPCADAFGQLSPAKRRMHRVPRPGVIEPEGQTLRLRGRLVPLRPRAMRAVGITLEFVPRVFGDRMKSRGWFRSLTPPQPYPAGPAAGWTSRWARAARLPSITPEDASQAANSGAGLRPSSFLT
jgi:hypothetical protein